MDNKKTTAAVLLAAGVGSRIRPVAEEPKCLLPVNGKTLLQRHLDNLHPLGVQDVILVVGYEQDKIRKALASEAKRFNFTFVENPFFLGAGNTGSMIYGLSEAPADVLVFDADVLCHGDIIREFLNSPHVDAILVGDSDINDLESSKVLVDEAGRVKVLVEKRFVTEEELATLSYAGESVGVLKFSAETKLKLIEASQTYFGAPGEARLNWEHLVNYYIESHDLPCHRAGDDRWTEIDTVEDYEQAMSMCGEVW